MGMLQGQHGNSTGISEEDHGSNRRILLGIAWEEHGNTAGILYRYYGNTVAGNTMGTAWKDRGNVMGIL